MSYVVALLVGAALGSAATVVWVAWRQRPVRRPPVVVLEPLPPAEPSRGDVLDLLERAREGRR